MDETTTSNAAGVEGESKPDNSTTNQPESTAVSKSEVIGVVANLSEYEAASMDLATDYWSPKEIGEVRRLVFWKMGQRQCMDEKTGELFQLDCVFFVESAGGVNKVIVNGSKRLVAVFESGDVAEGTPVQVTYLGFKENSTNNKKSATWSVVKLQPKKGE